MQSFIRPWLSPKLTTSMLNVMKGLGHRTLYSRGDVIYESPSLFEKLMFIRNGVVAKALLDPIREEPLLLLLGSSGSLCGSYENLYLRDRLPRRHYCLTSVEILVVNQELLLKIADQTPEWHQELSRYSATCALCDRLGMLLNRVGQVNQRLGALMLLLHEDQHPDWIKQLHTSGIEWLPITLYPGLATISMLLESNIEVLQDTIRGWWNNNDLKYRNHQYWFRRSTFIEYWIWIQEMISKNS